MKRFIVLIILVVALVSAMTYAAIEENARKVVTISDLISGGDQARVRLGARVSEGPIDITTEPRYRVTFSVQAAGDSSKDSDRILVVYNKALPDTLRPGRDVILEGSYRAGEFHADSLLTQCPSKYEPPVPSDYQKS